jgi:hypothetical protein
MAVPANPLHPDPAARLRTGRIIVLALVLGSATFMAVAVLLRLRQPNPPPDPPVLTYAALAAVPVQAVLAFVLPGLITRALRRATAGNASLPPGRPPTELADARGWALLAVWQARLVVRAALLEGAALLLITAYLIEGSPVTLAGTVLFVAALAAQFPTRWGLESWLDRQTGLLE